jgi:cytochrome oxidase Cu insertion factor (SCO1/SenC/PrrC family)
MSEGHAKAERRLTSLWLLIAVTIAPVLASYLAYYVWQPSRHVNYGELLEPRPLPDAALTLADGTPFRWRQLAGKWVLATADSGACDAYCRQKLVYLRQLRLAQGTEKERIERAWLITDAAAPEPALLAQHPGLWPIRASGADMLKLFPVAGSLADHIYVIDPLGNLMMRYPRDADPRKMLKDVARLLRHSNWR